MSNCYYCGKELNIEEALKTSHGHFPKYCNKRCAWDAKHYTNAGCTPVCQECGKDCISIKGLLEHIEKDHNMSYVEYAAKYIYHTTSTCDYCGKNLDFEHVRRGFRYCNRSCFSKSDLQREVGNASFSLNKYNPYWNYRNYIRWFEEEPDDIYLYVISTDTFVKVGICFDAYKRLAELYCRAPDVDNFNINLLLRSSPKLITAIEAYLKRIYTEVNEYYDRADLDGILDVLQNLGPWFELNNFAKDYSLIHGDFDVFYISNYSNVVDMMSDFYSHTQVNISDTSKFTYWDDIKYPFSGKIYDEKSDCVHLKIASDCDSKVLHLFELADGLVTHNCCRLRLNLKELFHRGGGLFGSGEKTGSIGVVTINLPQLGYLYKNDKEGFYKELDRLLVLAKDSLVLKRKTIEELMAGGFYPYSKVYVENYDTFFNTIGINGCNECIRNFTNDEHDIADEWGQAFTNELLDYINSRLSDFQEETRLLFNLEATPAEGTGYRFALHDKKNYPDIITANDDGDPYYTNSTWLPATYTDDIFEALDIQDQFQTKYTGGTVFHAYLGERVHDWKACAELIKSIFTNYRLPYLTISPTFSVCPKHGYLDGEQHFCPRCRDEELKKTESEIAKIKEQLKQLEEK